MITTLMNQKRGFNRFSKLPEDENPWKPNTLLKPGAKEKHRLTPSGLNSGNDLNSKFNVGHKMLLNNFFSYFWLSSGN